MKNMEQIEGVNYDPHLLARMLVQRKRQPKEVEWEWVQWRTQLLLGKLRHRNPVQINSENFRKRKSCKQA